MEIYFLLKNIFAWLWEIIKHPIFVSLLTYFVFDAILQYRKIIGKIDSKLFFYQSTLVSLGSINTDRANEEK